MSNMLKALKQLKAKGVAFSPQTPPDASAADDDVAKSAQGETLNAKGPSQSPHSDDSAQEQVIDPSITVLVGELPIADQSVEINSRIENTWQHLSLLIESEPERPDSAVSDSTIPGLTDDGSGDTAQILVIDESARDDVRSDGVSGTEPLIETDKTRAIGDVSDRDAIVGETDTDDRLDVTGALRFEIQKPADSEPEDHSPAMTLILGDLDALAEQSDRELQNEAPAIEHESGDTDVTIDSGPPVDPLVPTELNLTRELVFEDRPMTTPDSVDFDPRSTIPLADVGPLFPLTDDGWIKNDEQRKSHEAEVGGTADGEREPDAVDGPGLEDPSELDGGSKTGEVVAEMPSHQTLIVNDVETLATLARLDTEPTHWNDLEAEGDVNEPYDDLDGRQGGQAVDTEIASTPLDTAREHAAKTERFTLLDVDSSYPPADSIEPFPAAEFSHTETTAGSVTNDDLAPPLACDAIIAIEPEESEAGSALTSEVHPFRHDEPHDELLSVARPTSESHEQFGRDSLTDAFAEIETDPENIDSTAPARSLVAEPTSSEDSLPDLAHPVAEFARFVRDRLAAGHVPSQYLDALQKIRSSFPRDVSPAIVLIGADDEDHVTDASACLASTFAECEAGEVLLVDANFPKRTLTKRMGYADAPGLADVCEGIVPWHEAIVENTGEKNVSILPGGGWLTPMKSTAEVIRPLLAEWKKRFQMILVDAGSTDTMLADALCHTADATYLLVRLGQTERRQAEKAAAKLRSGGAKLSGCIVTNAPLTRDSNGTAETREENEATSQPPSIVKSFSTDFFRS